jgi:hypothetical protein
MLVRYDSQVQQISLFAPIWYYLTYASKHATYS